MLIGPAATAYLLTDRLSSMLGIALGLGAASSALGYLLARWLDCSIAGGMTVIIGLFFVIAFLFSPHHGVVTRAIRLRRLGLEARQALEAPDPDRLPA
jgi:manganese/zinc/iron transport system permease protein